MCAVSMVMDHYGDEWWRRLYLPPVYVPVPYPTPGAPPPLPPRPMVSPAEVEEFRRLLERAREYDRKNNEPDCELEAKKERVRKLAAELGVVITFL